MNQQERQTQVEYLNGLLDRMMEQYLSAGGLSPREGESLSPALFHKLYRAIMAEGYGQ